MGALIKPHISEDHKWDWTWAICIPVGGSIWRSFKGFSCNQHNHNCWQHVDYTVYQLCSHLRASSNNGKYIDVCHTVLKDHAKAQ